MTLDGMDIESSVVFDDGLNKEIFDLYVEKTLAPLLGKDEVLILDNLSVHMSKEAKALIEARGATILFLPAYSPDLSPIELAFSKVKAYLRKVKARVKDVLVEAILQALELIRPEDVQGWFLHCGYPLPAL